MKEIVLTMRQRGHVTIPAEVRRQFGLKPGDQVILTFDGENVRMSPISFTLETIFGSVQPFDHPSDFEEQIRIAKEERARDHQ